MNINKGKKGRDMEGKKRKGYGGGKKTQNINKKEKNKEEKKKDIKEK
jgi:hypothetical protein